jgi:hypothetical protein
MENQILSPVNILIGVVLIVAVVLVWKYIDNKGVQPWRK